MAAGAKTGDPLTDPLRDVANKRLAGRQGFKVFEEATACDLEGSINAWLAAWDGPDLKIRRTQLAAAFTPAGYFITALVNYEWTGDPNAGPMGPP